MCYNTDKKTLMVEEKQIYKNGVEVTVSLL